MGTFQQAASGALSAPPLVYGHNNPNHATNVGSHVATFELLSLKAKNVTLHFWGLHVEMQQFEGGH